jgi:alcohol dehydrogenase
MSPFLFATTAQILCESGSAIRLAELCKERSAARVMIVTDPGITQLGMLDDILPGFAKAGMAVEVFDAVQADPPESVVMAAVEQGRAMRADLVIGFGGGSSMDVAKLVAFLAHPGCQQQLQDIYGVGNAKGQRLPLIQVPTTAGTGSEVTQISIITTGETTKMGVVSPILLPDMALLDADLTLGLPPAVTAATGIDAMVHAIEAYTSKIKKNPVKRCACWPPTSTKLFIMAVTAKPVRPCYSALCWPARHLPMHRWPPCMHWRIPWAVIFISPTACPTPWCYPR